MWISPKKKALIAGLPRGAPPFALSGSWETGQEGWNLPGGIARGGTAPRTGSFSFYANAISPPRTATYQLTAAEVQGLIITVSVWHKMNINTGSRTISIGFDADAPTVVASANDNSTTYQLMSGSIAAVDGKAVTITLTADRYVVFDDWSITGTTS